MGTYSRSLLGGAPQSYHCPPQHRIGMSPAKTAIPLPINTEPGQLCGAGEMPLARRTFLFKLMTVKSYKCLTSVSLFSIPIIL